MLASLATLQVTETPLVLCSIGLRFSLMRKTMVTVALLCGGVGAMPTWASGSFANTSLGIGVSGFKLIGDGIGADWGLPLSLEYGRYIEGGFEVFLHPQFMVLQVATGAATMSGKGSVFGFGGHAGVRYLFLEESVRPYLALHLSVLGLALNPNYLVFVGLGPTVGIDFFVGESISLGIRGTFDTFFALNERTRFSLGGGIYASTYF
jgi:outer membrane protein